MRHLHWLFGRHHANNISLAAPQRNQRGAAHSAGRAEGGDDPADSREATIAMAEHEEGKSIRTEFGFSHRDAGSQEDIAFVIDLTDTLTN